MRKKYWILSKNVKTKKPTDFNDISKESLRESKTFNILYITYHSKPVYFQTK